MHTGFERPGTLAGQQRRHRGAAAPPLQSVELIARGWARQRGSGRAGAPEGAHSPVEVRLPPLLLERQPLPQRRLVHLPPGAARTPLQWMLAESLRFHQRLSPPLDFRQDGARLLACTVSFLVPCAGAADRTVDPVILPSAVAHAPDSEQPGSRCTALGMVKQLWWRGGSRSGGGECCRDGASAAAPG